MRSFRDCQKFRYFTLEFEQESESKTSKCVGVYSAAAGAESESKISDSVHLCLTPMFVCSVGKSFCHTIVKTAVYTGNHLQQSKEMEVFAGDDDGRSRSLVFMIFVHTDRAYYGMEWYGMEYGMEGKKSVWNMERLKYGME